MSEELPGIWSLFDEIKSCEINKGLTKDMILCSPVLPATILSKISMPVPSCSCTLFSVKDSEFMNDVIYEHELGIWILPCLCPTV